METKTLIQLNRLLSHSSKTQIFHLLRICSPLSSPVLFPTLPIVSFPHLFPLHPVNLAQKHPFHSSSVAFSLTLYKLFRKKRSFSQQSGMDFLTASPFSRPPISSAVAAGLVAGGGGQEASSTASELVERIVVGIITCAFALVGTPIGAVTGAFIGLATETGLFRGAGIGAIYGAVFSVEAVESSVALWHSHESGVSSILYVIDIICSLLTGRLVREKVGPAVQSAVQSQMSALELPYVEALDIFETGDTRGMSKDSVELLPILKITSENSCDCSGERIICSVCLQDIQIGETVRSLPFCKHMFHLRCIDSWLVRNGSCPLCRRDI